jgi:ABC-2 type transport system permease protein
VSLRSSVALWRASWLTSASYRLTMVLSIGSLLLTVVPVYFVARALQPLMQGVIAGEGGQYFAFVLVGTVTMSFVMTSVSSLPAAVGGGITNGFFESLLVTPSNRFSLLAGLSGYALAWTFVRGVLTLLAGFALGARIDWGSAPAALVILALIIVAHWCLGLVGTALVLSLRTMGPLPQIVFVASALLGGAYYPTSVIPSWIESLSSLVPVAYGLRALRGVLLEGLPLSAVSSDVLTLAAITVGLAILGGLSFNRALRYSRKTGSLSLY